VAANPNKLVTVSFLKSRVYSLKKAARKLLSDRWVKWNILNMLGVDLVSRGRDRINYIFISKRILKNL